MRRRLPALVLACLALALTACVHLVPPPGPAPLRYRDLVFSNVTTTTGVTYGSAVDQQGQTVTLALDVYRPAGDAATKRPAIVWVHGGGFRGGNRTSTEIVDEATTFAKKGYVTASISYRLSENGCSAPTAECVTAIQHARQDAQTAVRFLRANAGVYGIDVNRIAIGGTSAGAITALEVGFTPEAGGNPPISSAVRGAVSLSGARILSTPDPGEAASLLFHGTADSLVPYQWAVDTVDAARAAGLGAYLTTWEGEGHVPYAQHRTQILDQTTNFLYAVLDLAHAAP